MKAGRILLALAVLACALAPLALQFSVIAPLLVHHDHQPAAVMSLVGAVAWYALWLRALPAYTAARAPQHVLKAEAFAPDATDRGAPAITSPGGGPTGAGQPAAAGPTGGTA